MPPPLPPSVNAGRSTAGKPMSACTSSACSTLCAIPDRADPSPMRVIAALNFSRSSALSIAFFVAPIISTSNLLRIPSRAGKSQKDFFPLREFIFRVQRARGLQVTVALPQAFPLEGKQLVRRFTLENVKFPYALAWSGEDRVAVLVSDGAAPAAQAFVYELETLIVPGASARPVGEIHPLLDAWHGGFCNRLTAVPEYLTTSATDPASLRRLFRLNRLRLHKKAGG